MAINYIPRVTQLDAGQLDEQLEELLKQQLFNATKYLEVCVQGYGRLPVYRLKRIIPLLLPIGKIQPGILQPVLPELELLLRTWIFKYSIYDNKCTFGQKMLSLKYNTNNFSKAKLYWYYGYSIGLKYLKDRAVYSLTSNAQVQNYVYQLERFQLFGDILNFLRFIWSGKHPVLIDFILGLELTADKLTRENLTDFSWTRELLWHNFIELIGTVISLMNIFGLQRHLSNILKYMWWRQHIKPVLKPGPPTMTHLTVCASCSAKPVLPHTMGCSHIFCYYCLSTNKMIDPEFACPKCYFSGKEITRFVMT